MLILRKEFELGLRALGHVISVRAEGSYSKKNEGDKSAKKSHKEKEKATKNQEDATNETEDSAAERLNKLLASMQTEETSAKVKEIKLAKPGESTRKRREDIKQQVANKDIFVAAKRVAELIDNSGKHTKDYEMELLSKLLNQNNIATTPSTAEGQRSPIDEKSTSEQRLSELMVGMKIDNRKIPRETSRSDFVRRAMQASGGNAGKDRRRDTTTGGSVNLFGAQPLGIFKDTSKLLEMTDILSTWSQLQKHALQLQVMHPPVNYYDKVARWTEAGRVWQFPINNEQGLEEEHNVDFTEHIFLEQHLETWCPDKGPIRHFMELVCVGLSKNPYITAKEKKDHILWYRDYFESKKDMLKELMKTSAATASPPPPTPSPTNPIEIL